MTDQTNNRILGFVKGAGFTSGEAASVVLGQPDFTQSTPATTSTGVNVPGDGIAVDPSGNVWVTDWANNRVLEFTAPFTNGEAASVVLGQPDFTSSGAATTSTGMNAPNGIATDKSGDVWVADTGNNRILEFTPPFTNGMAASVVLGQPDFTQSTPATTSTGMNGPGGVGVESPGIVWVADSGNNRILGFAKGAGFTNGMAASVVLGQPDFTHSGSATTSTGLNTPIDVTADRWGNVWVADTGNNRVLEFTAPFFTNGEAASVVLGQPDFTSSGAATTSTGMNGPNWIAFDPSGNLWLADYTNNRVLEFQLTATSTSVSCSPSSLDVGSLTTCTAKVAGSSPSGTIAWSSTGPGTFSSGTCTLSSGSCSVGFTPSSPGAPTISASYSGDPNNSPSSGSFSLIVIEVTTTTSTATVTSTLSLTTLFTVHLTSFSTSTVVSTTTLTSTTGSGGTTFYLSIDALLIVLVVLLLAMYVRERQKKRVSS